MQDGVGRALHWFGSQFSSDWAEQSEQLGRNASKIVLAVLAAVGSSLVLTLILSFIEYSASVALVNKESQVWALLLTTFILFIAQLLFAPILLIGGAVLVKWRRRIESRAAAHAG